MAFKPLKSVVRPQKGYNGLVSAARGYEPTLTSEILRNSTIVVIDCEISRFHKSRVGLYSLVSPREIW